MLDFQNRLKKYVYIYIYIYIENLISVKCFLTRMTKKKISKASFISNYLISSSILRLAFLKVGFYFNLKILYENALFILNAFVIFVWSFVRTE